jgi:hypothetical protein
MGLSLWYLCGLIDWNSAAFSTRLLSLGAIVIAGACMYILSALAVRSPEAVFLLKKVSGRR